MSAFDTQEAETEDGAARWAGRLGAGRLSVEERREFEAWLAADTRNPVRLKEYRKLYSKVARGLPELVREGRVTLSDRRPARLLRSWLAPATLAACLAVGALAWWWTPQSLRTPFAQRTSVELADGSQVQLNAGTSLKAYFRLGQRRVVLKSGEAYFSVVSNPQRPFVVETPAGPVRVLGTSFNVRVTEANQVCVTVLEGSVQVNPTDASASTLRAADQWEKKGSAVSTLRLTPEAARDTIAWREGKTVFVNETLPRAIGRFAAYHGVAIEVSAELSSLELGGQFSLDDLEQFLKNLEISFPVRVLKMPGGSVRVVPR